MSKTVTDATVFRAFKKMTEKSIGDEVKQEIQKQVSAVMIHTAKLVEYYQWLNKAKVLVDGKPVICKVLNRCGGSVVDLYTPLGTDSFNEKMKEPCVIPFDYLDCLVVDINSGDNEWLLLGYYMSGNMVITTPAEKGDYKIARVDALDEQEFTMRSEPSYTKSEVDEMVSELKKEIEELKAQIKGEENDDSSSDE